LLIIVRSRTVSLVALAFSLTMMPRPALAAPGDLDGTFGRHGRVITNLTPGNDGASDVAIQANGKVVVAGRASSRRGYGRFAVTRYRANGGLDPTFGGDGVVITNFAKREDSAAGVAIQADGKIVAAGGANPTARISKFAVARYNTDGTLDSTFGGNGKVTTGFSGGQDDGRDVAIQADGKIVVAGTTDQGEFAIARYHPDGTLDTSFDGDGKATADITAEYDAVSAVAIDADGKIVVAGYGGDLPLTFALTRFNADGTLDTTFDGDGVVTTDLTEGFDNANAVAIQSDGKIVAAGEAGFCCEYTGSFGLVRYDSDGALDTTFSGDGKVFTNFTNGDDSASAVAIQSDGKIVAAGSEGFNGASSRFALVRYEADGTRDPTFGDQGKVVTRFSRGFDGARAVAIQADGRILAVGSTYPDIDGLDGLFALARYRDDRRRKAGAIASKGSPTGYVP
jgi:uncharacterized delta-60 repeat protein